MNKRFLSFFYRPGLHRFLTHMSSMYELSVYTMGNEAYASAFLNKIDPHRRLFKGKLLTRDGNGCILKKKLSRLYPTNKSQVLILDDCANVWDNCSNLVQIKPYYYFKNIKQINPLSYAKPIKSQFFSIVNNYSSNNSRYSYDEGSQDEFKLDGGSDYDFLVPAIPITDNDTFSISSTNCTNKSDTFFDKSIADIIPEAKENDDTLENVGKVCTM